MLLKSLRVQNHKSITDIKLDFVEPVTGIFGTAGCGKSAILECVGIIRDWIGLGWTPELFYEPCILCDKDSGTSIELTVEDTETNVYRYGLTYVSDGLLNEWLVINDEVIYENKTPEKHPKQTVLSMGYEDVSKMLKKLLLDRIVYATDRIFCVYTPAMLNYIVNREQPKDMFLRLSDVVEKLDVGIKRIEFPEDEKSEKIMCVHRIDGKEYRKEITREPYGIQKILSFELLSEFAKKHQFVLIFDDIDIKFPESVLLGYLESLKDSGCQVVFSATNSGLMDGIDSIILENNKGTRQSIERERK